MRWKLAAYVLAAAIDSWVGLSVAEGRPALISTSPNTTATTTTTTTASSTSTVAATTTTTTTTQPSTQKPDQPATTITAAPEIVLTNPTDVNYALTVEAQQLIGRNPTATEDQSFGQWYTGQEIAAESSQPPEQPPTPQAAAYQWLYANDRIEIAANQYLNLSQTITCMIQTGGNPCPATTPTTQP